MPLSLVEQGHHLTGCFVACVAMLKRTTYEEAFKLVHPKRDFSKRNHGIKNLDPKAPIDIARRKLKRIGLEPKSTNLKKISRLKKTAIIVIRWSFAPELLHAIVWDAEAKQILDPSTRYPYQLPFYERQLESIIYVESKAS